MGARLVIDLSADVSGGFCGRLLAMNGHRVVRPSCMIGWAEAAALPRHEFVSLYLDGPPKEPLEVGELSDPRFEACLANAELVLVSRHGAELSSGRDVDELRRATGDATLVVTSSFGMTGPYGSFKGSPLIDWASGGWLYITGEPDREPLSGPLTLCSYIAGYTAAVAAEAAMLDDERCSERRVVDISTMEAMMSTHQSTFSRAALGELRVRTGRYYEVYPLGVHACRDALVCIGVSTDPEFDRLGIAIGRPDLAVDPRFADGYLRLEHRAELDAELEPWLADHDHEEVLEVFASLGIPAAKVASTLDVLANPQLAAREFWRQAEHCGTRVRIPGNPLVECSEATDVVQQPAENPTPESRGSSPGTLPLDAPPWRVAQSKREDRILVLDFTHFWAGPSATKLLADLGARVVRIEPLSTTSWWPTTDFMDLADEKWQRGKESIQVDLKSPDGIRLMRSLAARADVLVENYRPGVMARLGLSYEVLREENPVLVYVSIGGFGSGGPWGGLGSYGPTLEAISSMQSRTCYDDGVPLRLGHALPDATGGLVGALSALVGLRRRRDTGHGGCYDLSQLEAYVCMSGEDTIESSATGRAVIGTQNRHPTQAPHGVYPCRGDDEWVAIACLSDRDWAALRGVAELGRECHERWSTTAARKADEEALDRVVADWTRRRDKFDVAYALQEVGVSALPAMKATDLVDDTHARERRFFVAPEWRGRRPKLPGSAITSSPPLTSSAGRAPIRGAHTRSVLRDLVGLDDREIDELLTRRVVGSASG